MVSFLRPIGQRGVLARGESGVGHWAEGLQFCGVVALPTVHSRQGRLPPVGPQGDLLDQTATGLPEQPFVEDMDAKDEPVTLVNIEVAEGDVVGSVQRPVPDPVQIRVPAQALREPSRR